jgi:hypothetical protein
MENKLNIFYKLLFIFLFSFIGCSSFKNKYGYVDKQVYEYLSPTYQKEFYVIYFFWGIGQDVSLDLDRYCGKRLPFIQTYYPDMAQVINLLTLDLIHTRAIRIECF